MLLTQINALNLIFLVTIYTIKQCTFTICPNTVGNIGPYKDMMKLIYHNSDALPINEAIINVLAINRV